MALLPGRHYEDIMKKLLTILFVLLLTAKAYSSPNNSVSIVPVATDGATITASDENSRNNVVSAAYNAHDHNDIDQTANTLSVGDAAAGNKQISANNADTNKPFIRYDDTNNYWVFSENGVMPSVAIHGNALIFEGTTDDAFETTLTVTDPTADRTQTIQNNSGVVPLGTAGNTLFLTTTGATNITLLTSGTMVSTAGASTNIDIGDYELRAQTLQADIATGTAPMTIASTTKVTNLNADTLDGVDSTSFSRKTLYTSDDTFTAPTGITKVYLTMVGGGGGGGGGDNSTKTGGGGSGGGALVKYPYTVVAGNNYTVDVGAGGAGGAAGVSGSVGANSTFDTSIIAIGGNFGSSLITGIGGASVFSTTQAVVRTGSIVSIVGSRAGSNGDSSNGWGGVGGSSFFGVGADGGLGSSNGSSAVANTGAGGGGAGQAASNTGGNGGSGFVLVEW